MKKRIFLLAGVAALLSGVCLTSCGGTDGYAVQVLLTEADGYTITSENPLTVKAGTDAVFQVQLDEGYNFVQADSGAVWNEGTLTVPAVWYPTTVNMAATDADEKVKFSWTMPPAAVWSPWERTSFSSIRVLKWL